MQTTGLKKTLGPLMIWGLGVGYVISGMYCGWNLGLPVGGTYGMLAATLIVTLMYVTFVLGYAELSASMPRAGGAFVYAHHALGPNLGFLSGMAQGIEFLFAPPAIALAIGAYVNLFFPEWSPISIAFVAYLLFTGLNIYGVQHSAAFGLIITILAVAELLIFSAVTAPSFSLQAFQQNPLPNGWMGIFPAIPYAIWFYLAIEGLANVSEELKDPQKDLFLGFMGAMFTLVVLALLVFFTAIGVNGWESIVYKAGTLETSDSPLPLALAQVVGEGHIFYHMLVGIGLCGLLASFHGIILIAGRATFEFGRVGYAPRFIGVVNEGRKTPANALIVNMIIGFLALLSGKTGEIITISVFGALTLYILSTLSLLKLRTLRPHLHRPFRCPLYPWIPYTALFLSVASMLALIYYNFILFLIYLTILAFGYLWYFFKVPKDLKSTAFESL